MRFSKLTSRASDSGYLSRGAPNQRQAQDRVIGLLALPEVFGNAACDRFTPKQLPIYATPDSTAMVGVIRVDEYWTFYNNGGCGGLTVNVHPAGVNAAHLLPAEEYDYEAPGAVVVAQQRPWFKVRLADGAAWVRASAQAEFYPLERLYEERLTYLTTAWDGRLAKSAGGVTQATRTPVTPAPSVRVISAQRESDQLWFYVEVLSYSGCEPGEEPKVTERGWVPAYSPSGERSIWFHSRGC